MQGPLGTSTPAELAAAAFPALQRLDLEDVILDWEDLRALKSCSQLSFLRVVTCALPAKAPASSPLAALPSLRELHARWTSCTLAQGLTQLTSMHLHSRVDTLSHLITRCLQGLQQLQQLELFGSDAVLPAPLVAQLFSAAPRVRDLRVGSTIGQPAFDALLAHGTNLTRLSCRNLHLTEDRSRSACSWKELVVRDGCCVPRTLAYLPLHSLSRVCLGEWRADYCKFEIPSACPYFKCWLSTVSSGVLDCTPAEIQAALTLLWDCPAWQDSGPSVHVSLFSQRGQQSTEGFTQSLLALGAVANKEVQLTVDAGGLSMAADILEHLGATLGASLTHLTLATCSITHDFWPAVWRHLPGLQELSIGSSVGGVVSSNVIKTFCSRATRPLSLKLGTRLFISVVLAEQLEQQRRTWGAPQVTVTELTTNLY
jgi:hypothetical protein